MFDRVREIIARFTEVDDITVDSSLMADLGLSSFDLVAIVSEFEDEFGIEVPDGDLMGFMTVNDILTYLDKHAG